LNGKTGLGIGIGAGAGIMLVMIIILAMVVFPENDGTFSSTEQTSTQETSLTAQERADQRLEEKKKEMGWDADTTQNNLNSAEIKNQELEKMLADQERQAKYELELQKMRDEAERQRMLEEQERQRIIEESRTNPLLRGMINGEISIYVAPAEPDVSNDVRAVIDKFRNSMNSPFPNAPLQLKTTTNPNDADIQISWVKNYGSHTAGLAIFKSVVQIGMGSENCMGDWQPFDAQTVAVILLHELGHSLGHSHSNDPTNIMYYKTDTRFEKDYEGNQTIDEGHLYTIPFCKAGTYHYNIVGSSQSNGFFTYVTTAGTNSVDFLNNGDGLYYPSCSSDDDYISFSRTCNVQQGDSLVIYNKDDILKFGAINVDISIIDQRQREMPNIEYSDDTFEYDEEYLQKVSELFR